MGELGEGCWPQFIVPRELELTKGSQCPALLQLSRQWTVPDYQYAVDKRENNIWIKLICEGVSSIWLMDMSKYAPSCCLVIQTAFGMLGSLELTDLSISRPWWSVQNGLHVPQPQATKIWGGSEFSRMFITLTSNIGSKAACPAKRPDSEKTRMVALIGVEMDSMVSWGQLKWDTGNLYCLELCHLHNYIAW